MKADEEMWTKRRLDLSRLGEVGRRGRGKPRPYKGFEGFAVTCAG
jgi:hypothetical protein